MPNNNEQFTPDEINEQIRRFSSTSPHTLQAGANPNRRLLQDLRHIYRDSDTGKDTHSLQRSWQRIVSTQQQSGHYIQATFKDRKVLLMKTFMKEAGKASSIRTPGQRINGLLATAVALFLIGSMILTFALIRSHQTVQTPTTNTQTGTSGSSSSTQRITAKQGDTITVFQQPDYAGVYGVDWSPNGTRIVSSGTDFYTWDATTGQSSVKYDGTAISISSVTQKGYILVPTDQWAFPKAQWSPDSKSFALADNSTIRIWDGTTYKLIKSLHYAFQYYSGDSGKEYMLFAHWSSDGKSIKAIATIADAPNGPTNKLVTFDVATGKQSEVTLALSGQLHQVAWSPNGNYLAATDADQSRVYVINLDTGQAVYTYNGPAKVTDLIWSPDSKRIASGIGQGKDITQVWDALTGNNVMTHQGGTLPAWSPNGQYIATGRSAGKAQNDQIQIWDAVTGKTIYVYTGDQGHVYALTWSPDSKYIAAGENSEDGKTSDVRVWAAFA
jgi:WD40 repeat protein